MSNKNKGNLLAIIDSCSKINKFTVEITDAEELFEDEKTFDAVLMNFVIIGESVTRLSDDFKEKENEIHWAKIKVFRNIVAHDYFGVDAEEVWQIIQNDLAELKQQVEKLTDLNK